MGRAGPAISKKPVKLGAGTAVPCPYKGVEGDGSDAVAGAGLGVGAGDWGAGHL
jgi:hypothetical protein